MAEKVFKIDRKLATTNINNLRNINKAVQDELEAGRPVYATIPNGTFEGSIARLRPCSKDKIGGYQSPKQASRIFTDGLPSYQPKMNQALIWELEIDGTNRTYYINWCKLFPRFTSKISGVEIYLGRTTGTELKRSSLKDLNQTLVDFLGREVHDGDYVLMYNTPWELKDTGSPFRMLRYTGKRSPKQATFNYVNLKGGKHTPDGGERIRVGLNARNGEKTTDVLYGVKVDVDESLSTALQMTDHDMSIYPVRFLIGLEDNSTV